jgi:hypothetical protein
MVCGLSAGGKWIRTVGPLFTTAAIALANGTSQIIMVGTVFGLYTE